MELVAQRAPSKRHHERTIIHFDMDCFYAAVFEVANPALRSLPLAVQQKHIIVTCNYEARRRGLHKLQLVSEARRICPDIVIVLGEDLTPFRDASKSLYAHLHSFSWNHRLEKLGFDEIFMDVSDMVHYNAQLLNPNDLQHSWFCLDRHDPTKGFDFDARHPCGPTFPEANAMCHGQDPLPSPDASPLAANPRHQHHREHTLRSRLILGSWLAQHLRQCLEEHTGYTATVGISTNKLLSKLVGNLNKPRSQTVLLPPYVSTSNSETSPAQPSTITTFLSTHDICKIPGIGFKTSQKLRDHVLSSTVPQAHPYNNADTRPKVTVRALLSVPSLSPSTLTRILSTPGAPRDLGTTVWNLLHGIDDTEVKHATPLPTQISIEDSYRSLATIPHLTRELRVLSAALLARMRVDLVVDTKWLAFPRTLRLTTRLRGDGEGKSRVSRSCPLPRFVFALSERVEGLAGRLVDETLLRLFRRLHPSAGWDLSLLNVAVVNLDASAGAGGMDIGALFVRAREVPPHEVGGRAVGGDAVDEIEVECENEDGAREDGLRNDAAAEPSAGYDAAHLDWDDEESCEVVGIRCAVCGAHILPFAMRAHARFHAAGGA